MSNPRSRVLPQLVNVYLFVMFAHCADLFVQKLSGDLSVLVTNLYGHVVGILCVFVACLIKRKDVRILHVCGANLSFSACWRKHMQRNAMPTRPSARNG